MDRKTALELLLDLFFRQEPYEIENIQKDEDCEQRNAVYEEGFESVVQNSAVWIVCLRNQLFYFVVFVQRLSRELRVVFVVESHIIVFETLCRYSTTAEYFLAFKLVYNAIFVQDLVLIKLEDGRNEFRVETAAFVFARANGLRYSLVQTWARKHVNVLSS